MRRVSVVDLQLLATIGLWALNITVTRYVLTHGFLPLAYGTTRSSARSAWRAATCASCSRRHSSST